MSTTPFPLSLIVPVSVLVSPLGVVAPGFNTGLIVGSSTVIPSVGANSRTRSYTLQNWQAAMIADGFNISDPEYICVGLYFATGPSKPAPQAVVVGRQDLTALATFNPTSGNLGTGYAVNDLVTVVHAGASGGVLRVSTIGANGSVTGLAKLVGQQGTGYIVSNANATTTTGSGTGLEVDITAIGETCTEAFQACRLLNSVWYGGMVIGAVTADHEAIANLVQSMVPQSFYAANTADAAVFSGAANNLLSFLKSGEFGRITVDVMSTQGGLYPNQIYGAAAWLGLIMGLNTGLANSAFTAGLKELPQMQPENTLTESQRETILGNNGNLYLNLQNSYTKTFDGKMSNGQFIDEVVGLDMLASDAQIQVINALTSLPSVPLTDQGQAILLAAAAQACKNSATRGFIVGGTWTGPQVLGLNTGDPVPAGYKVQSESFTKQAPSDRAARKGMPIYISIILAGSIQSVTIGIYVQR